MAVTSESPLICSVFYLLLLHEVPGRWRLGAHMGLCFCFCSCCSTHVQCCQLGDFVAISGDFSTPLNDFFCQKRLATNLATFPGVIGDFLRVLTL